MTTLENNWNMAVNLYDSCKISRWRRQETLRYICRCTMLIQKHTWWC